MRVKCSHNCQRVLEIDELTSSEATDSPFNIGVVLVVPSHRLTSCCGQFRNPAPSQAFTGGNIGVGLCAMGLHSPSLVRRVDASGNAVLVECEASAARQAYTFSLMASTPSALTA